VSNPSPEQLMAFLRTDARDVGCDEALRILSAYVELVIAASRQDAETRYPGVAAHLQACGPCGTDYEGLLAAVRTLGGATPDDPS